MSSILKIRRDWSLLHFEIRRHRRPHNIMKIRRDWSLPFGEIRVPFPKEKNAFQKMIYIDLSPLFLSGKLFYKTKQSNKSEHF